MKSYWNIRQVIFTINYKKEGSLYLKITLKSLLLTEKPKHQLSNLKQHLRILLFISKLIIWKEFFPLTWIYQLSLETVFILLLNISTPISYNGHFQIIWNIATIHQPYVLPEPLRNHSTWNSKTMDCS